MNSKFHIEEPLLLLSNSPTKPLNHIEKLVDAIYPYSQEFLLLKNEALRYTYNNKRVCYILLEGTATLHRRGDGLILNTEIAPFILGVSSLQTQRDHLYIRVSADARISHIPLERLGLVIAKEELWENLCHLIIYTASRVYEHCMMISQLSSYDIIRLQLLELMHEPERQRLNITAANYILNRTYLSRSGIMRILAKLRDENYITLDRGVLISIDHLPLKY